MTQPASPFTRATRNFFDRRFAPLIVMWIVAAVLVGVIYWFQRTMPAFDEVVKPVYALVIAVAAVFSWRWIRTRGKGDRRDQHDRRRTDRRNTSEFQTKPPET